MNFDYFNYKSNYKVKKGSIIFSQPLMNDKNFKRSIILICEHGRDGSFGYKLNDKVDCEYLEINVRNDDQLVKMAGIVQRLISAESKAGSEDEFGLSEEEKSQLLSNLEDSVKDIQEESDKINNKIESISN